MPRKYPRARALYRTHGAKTGFAASYFAPTQPQLAEVEFEREALLKRSKQRNLMIAGAVRVA